MRETILLFTTIITISFIVMAFYEHNWFALSGWVCVLLYELKEYFKN